MCLTVTEDWQGSCCYSLTRLRPQPSILHHWKCWQRHCKSIWTEMFINVSLFLKLSPNTAGLLRSQDDVTSRKDFPLLKVFHMLIHSLDLCWDTWCYGCPYVSVCEVCDKWADRRVWASRDRIWIIILNLMSMTWNGIQCFETFCTESVFYPLKM